MKIVIKCLKQFRCVRLKIGTDDLIEKKKMFWVKAIDWKLTNSKWYKDKVYEWKRKY